MKQENLKVILVLPKGACISLFDGKIAWSFYLSDYNSIDEMMKSALSSLMKRKYKGWNVYVHNGSLFDYIFLLRYITEMGHVEPLIKYGKFINIKLSWDKQVNDKGIVKYKYNINFRDSLLLLPAPLRKLAVAFNVENKGFFPFNFLKDSNIPLDYKGNTPDFSLYEGITRDEYDAMVSIKWDLRREVIKYCELDCKVLYQVIDKFNDLIFEKWRVPVNKYNNMI